MADARLKVRGTVSKLRTWQGSNGGGWSAAVKDEGEYGRTYEITGDGDPHFEDGDTVTAVGEPTIKWAIFRAEVTGPVKREETEIPF